jgi:hypothetical protein
MVSRSALLVEGRIKQRSSPATMALLACGLRLIVAMARLVSVAASVMTFACREPSCTCFAPPERNLTRTAFAGC